MSMFVEVYSVEKGCQVIINMDLVLEIAPLVEGGCALFFADAAAVNGKSAMKVKDSYSQFQQFVMRTVSADDIAARFPKQEPETKEEPVWRSRKPATKKEPAPVGDIPAFVNKD